MAQPSAAAAAGAAAAALLQSQLFGDAGARSDAPNGGWTEHQTGDGRKFYVHEVVGASSWEKPDILMTPEERANDTKWGEYRIWDGRVFYHHKETKVSCWRMPPELRKAREGISGIDERPLPPTFAEKRQALLKLKKERGVSETWTWEAADAAVAEEPQAEALTEAVRKQCFAELISHSMRKRQIDEREKQRNAANALERLIEERFGGAERVGAKYEDAAKAFQDAEPWKLIKSDVRRNEVFQTVMERLEEKHKKVRSERRAERVLRLQRFIGSDPELKRTRLRWKDALTILAKRDEIQEEGDMPMEALLLWASLRDLRQATEHEAETKARHRPDKAAEREDRQRRDAFITYLKELVGRGRLQVETTWAQLEAAYAEEPRVTALREGRGATAMELFDEFQELLRQGLVTGLTIEDKEDEPLKKEEMEPPSKRHRFDDDPFAGAVRAQAAAAQAAAAVAARVTPRGEDVSALDALIMGSGPGGADGESEEESDDEDDPLMGVVNRAAAAKKAAEVA